MYTRFTDRARKVMELANQESQRLNHEYIGTEHILIGIVEEGTGVAFSVLKKLGIDPRKIRLEVAAIVPPSPEMNPLPKLPVTARAKTAVGYSMDEAHNLKHDFVGTEHLLLGLLREEDGVAAQVLCKHGVKLDDARKEILRQYGAGPEGIEKRGIFVRSGLFRRLGRMVVFVRRRLT